MGATSSSTQENHRRPPAYGGRVSYFSHPENIDYHPQRRGWAQGGQRLRHALPVVVDVAHHRLARAEGLWHHLGRAMHYGLWGIQPQLEEALSQLRLRRLRLPTPEVATAIASIERALEGDPWDYTNKLRAVQDLWKVMHPMHPIDKLSEFTGFLQDRRGLHAQIDALALELARGELSLEKLHEGLQELSRILEGMPEDPRTATLRHNTRVMLRRIEAGEEVNIWRFLATIVTDAYPLSSPKWYRVGTL